MRIPGVVTMRRFVLVIALVVVLGVAGQLFAQPQRLVLSTEPERQAWGQVADSVLRGRFTEVEASFSGILMKSPPVAPQRQFIAGPPG